MKLLCYILIREVVKMFQTVFKRYEKKYLLNEKQYNNIIVSSPELTVGSSYTVTIGGTVTGCDQNGYTVSGKVTGGDSSFAVEISSVSTSYGASGGMGGKPGRENGGKKPFDMG